MRRRSRSRLRSFGRVFLIALVIALAFPLVTAERTFDLVPPNAAALIESLRAFGYTPETAIADLVDNQRTLGRQGLDGPGLLQALRDHHDVEIHRGLHGAGAGLGGDGGTLVRGVRRALLATPCGALP